MIRIQIGGFHITISKRGGCIFDNKGCDERISVGHDSNNSHGIRHAPVGHGWSYKMVMVIITAIGMSEENIETFTSHGSISFGIPTRIKNGIVKQITNRSTAQIFIRRFR